MTPLDGPVPHARPDARRRPRRDQARLPQAGQGAPPGRRRPAGAAAVPRDPGRLRAAGRRQPDQGGPTPAVAALLGGSGPCRRDPSCLRRANPANPSIRQRVRFGSPQHRHARRGLDRGRHRHARRGTQGQGHARFDVIRRGRCEPVRARLGRRELVRDHQRHLLDDQPEGVRRPAQARTRVPGARSSGRRRPGGAAAPTIQSRATATARLPLARTPRRPSRRTRRRPRVRHRIRRRHPSTRPRPGGAPRPARARRPSPRRPGRPPVRPPARAGSTRRPGARPARRRPTSGRLPRTSAGR